MNPLNRRAFLLAAALGGTPTALEPLLASTDAEPVLKPGQPRTKAQLNQAVARIEALGKEFLGVAPAEGRFFHLLVRLTRARRVLELGGCFGLGSLWLALALEPNKGSLTSIEILPDRASQAKKHLADFGLAKRTTVLAGNAHELVPTLRGKFDLVILNADKSGALDYFQKLARHGLAADAVLAINGVVREPEKMRPVVEAIAAHPDFDATAVQVMPEDGFLLACRRS